jgi:hypothetical protein
VSGCVGVGMWVLAACCVVDGTGTAKDKGAEPRGSNQPKTSQRPELLVSVVQYKA